jgi:hypothetical protein
LIETNSKSKSQFVGYLGVKNVEKIERDLILPLVQKFFAARNIQSFKPIDESAAILDFDRKNFDDFFAHFYEFRVKKRWLRPDLVFQDLNYTVIFDWKYMDKSCFIDHNKKIQRDVTKQLCYELALQKVKPTAVVKNQFIIPSFENNKFLDDAILHERLQENCLRVFKADFSAIQQIYLTHD